MASSKACLVVIIDGLGDLPNPQLGGQTPLEAAATPALNRLASIGRHGLVDPIARGIVPNTHSGTGLLMGMLPEQEGLLSRGPVEAAGAGVSLQDGDIAFRANFATFEVDGDTFRLLDRRAGRVTTGSEQLAAALDGMDLGDGITVRIQATDQHRCVLVLQGLGLDARVGPTDPGDRAMPSPVLRAEPHDPAAFFTAAKLRKFTEQAHEILDKHPLNESRRSKGLLPANGVITRGAGAAFDLDSEPRINKVPTAVVAGCNTVLGMASLLGFEPISDDRFTADTMTDLAAKIDVAVRALAQHGLVFVHFKAPDILSHDCDPLGKRDFIEKIDQEIGRLGLPNHGLLVTADHSTDSGSGSHTADPVPVLFYVPENKRQEPSDSVNFSEATCRTGNLSRRSGYEMLREVIQFIT